MIFFLCGNSRLAGARRNGSGVLVRALTSGFYGAMTQHLSLAEPEWQGRPCRDGLFLPLSSHSEWSSESTGCAIRRTSDQHHLGRCAQGDLYAL